MSQDLYFELKQIGSIVQNEEIMEENCLKDLKKLTERLV